MKRLPILLLVAYATLVFTACKKENNTTVVAPKHLASLMFVNGCAGTTQLSGMYGSKVADGASAINLFSNTLYQYVTVDSPSVAVNISFNTTPTRDTLFTLLENRHYTAFAGGTAANPTITFVEDHLDGAGGGAKIRFVNLSGDVQNVTFQVGGTTLFTGVYPAQITGFADIAAGETSFTIFDPGNVPTTQRTYGLRSIEGGKYYTVYLTGTTTGTANYYLQMTQIVTAL